MMKKASARVALILLLGLVVGCASIAELAPPVTENMVRVAAESGIQRTSLEQGRHLYLVDCTKCHSPVKIESLTRDQWSEVLPRMVQMTRLDPESLGDLEAYINSVTDK